MAEINIKLKAEQLGIDLQNVGIQAKKAFDTALEQLSLNCYAEAQRLAAQKLHSAREDYLNALKYEKLSDNMYVIYLSPKSWLANALEEGIQPHSMISALINGPKSKPTKTGRMNIIPLQSRPYSKEPARKQMVTDIRSAIRKIEKDNSIEKIVRNVNEGKITKYKGNIPGLIKGVTKVTSTKGKRNQSHYVLFRAVSNKSDPNSWYHTGTQPLNIFPQIQKFVDDNLERIMKAIF